MIEFEASLLNPSAQLLNKTSFSGGYSEKEKEKNIQETWKSITLQKLEMLELKKKKLIDEMNFLIDSEFFSDWLKKYSYLAMVHFLKDVFFKTCIDLCVQFPTEELYQFLQSHILLSSSRVSLTTLLYFFEKFPHEFANLTNTDCKNKEIIRVVSKSYAELFRENKESMISTVFGSLQKFKGAKNFHEAYHLFKLLEIFLDFDIVKNAGAINLNPDKFDLELCFFVEECCQSKRNLEISKICIKINLETSNDIFYNEIPYDFNNYHGEETLEINTTIQHGHHLGKACKWDINLKEYLLGSNENKCVFTRVVSSNSRDGDEYVNDVSRHYFFVLE